MAYPLTYKVVQGRGRMGKARGGGGYWKSVVTTQEAFVFVIIVIIAPAGGGEKGVGSARGISIGKWRRRLG